MTQAIDPDDNLVHYFAIHTVAVQAEGGSPATIRLYDGSLQTVPNLLA